MTAVSRAFRQGLPARNAARPTPSSTSRPRAADRFALMAKKSRTKARQSAPLAEGEVGPRQPCPCGSGKRYKACHGAAGNAPAPFVSRPFEGLPSECDVVALRELVPAATA